MEEQVATTFATIGWPAASAVILCVLAILGFAATVVKMYYDHKKEGGQESGKLGNRLSSIEAEIEQIKKGLSNTDVKKVNEHSEEILKIKHGMDSLKQELDHIKETFSDKDNQAMMQIEEMKRTLDKLTDMLIRMISSGS